MKIVVNARPLIKPYTGMAQFAQNIFLELAREDAENEYVLVVPEKVDLGDMPGNLKLKVLKEKALPGAGLRKTFWEQVQFPSLAKREGAGKIFHTYPANAWFGGGEIVTVHDCIPWMDSNYRKGLLSRLYHFMTRRAVKKAGKVVTVSETSKKDVVSVCGVSGEKIVVAYNDADEVYKAKSDADFDAEVLKEVGVKKGEYFLYVGGYDSRKNVDYLLKEHEGSKFPLVLTGGKQFNSKLYGSLDLEREGIVKTGFVPGELLAALYRNCRAYVNFSRCEGFNIPILEAANCGAALVLSDIPVHREVAKDAAIFVDIEKEGAGKKAMMAVSDGERKSLALAEKYSIKDSVKVIKKILNES
jgi:glycosyltransferase involved in cell wall biosynthesis